jgi:c-di-GMP-binding flagellar brake protein YcgR
MKLIISSYFILLFSIGSFAQPTLDIILKHTGEQLKVKIISVDEKITFTYPNETSNQVIAKNCVREIIFSSGRVQEITEKIIVNGEDDWQKVIVTTNPDDIKCLNRKGEVRSSASNTWNFKGKDAIDKKATMKIKMEAAKLKAHIIFIQDQVKTGQTYYSGASSEKYGVAYSY